MTIEVSPPPPVVLPDLVVSDLAKDSFTVKNQGDAAAGPFLVSVTNSNTGTARRSPENRATSAPRGQLLFRYSARSRASLTRLSASSFWARRTAR